MRSKSAPETKCQSVSNTWKPEFQAGIDASALLVPVEAPQPSQFEGSDDGSQVFVQALWPYGFMIKASPRASLVQALLEDIKRLIQQREHARGSKVSWQLFYVNSLLQIDVKSLHAR